jgi:hypothetical protein
MNTTSYSDKQRMAEATPPGEHVTGPPSPGLAFIWVVWLLAAAVMLVIGGLVFVGILQAVS